MTGVTFVETGNGELMIEYGFTPEEPPGFWSPGYPAEYEALEGVWLSGPFEGEIVQPWDAPWLQELLETVMEEEEP